MSAPRRLAVPAPPWPPPPHDPRERELVAATGGWEVRAFPVEGRFHAYFAPRGLLHLQLWHPRAGVSVLTPSRLTDARYEIYSVDGWKARAHDLSELSAVLRARFGLALPHRTRIRALERWLVDRATRDAVAERST